MALPALDIFRSLDQALAAAVSAAAPAVVHVSRGRGGGTGIAWADELVISSSFHTPDRTRVGIRRPTASDPWFGQPGWRPANS